MVHIKHRFNTPENADILSWLGNGRHILGRKCKLSTLSERPDSFVICRHLVGEEGAVECHSNSTHVPSMGVCVGMLVCQGKLLYYPQILTMPQKKESFNPPYYRCLKGSFQKALFSCQSLRNSGGTKTEGPSRFPRLITYWIFFLIILPFPLSGNIFFNYSFNSVFLVAVLTEVLFLLSKK